MKSRPNTGFGFLLVGIILFLGCQSMYLGPGDGGGGGSASGGAGTNFAQTGTAGSFFSAVQVDPRSEDSAGPSFAAAGDLDGDGLADIASAWNESQPVQIHLQRRAANGSIAFETVPLGGTTPIAQVAGLELADMDADGRLDVVVLIKDTGQAPTCDPSREDCDVTNNGGVIEGAIQGGIAIFYNPQDTTGVPWTATLITTSLLPGRTESETPEEIGYTGLAVGDVDGLSGPDIVVALNSAEGQPGLPLNAAQGIPQVNTIDLWPNPGSGVARNGDAWARSIIHQDLPSVSAVQVSDVDRDGDNDVVCTYPGAASSNVRWIPNPLDLGDVNRVYGMWPMFAPIGQISTGAGTIEIGDLDGDSYSDVLVRSSGGRVVQWFKGPAFPSFDFIRNPWQVYTLAEFRDREPRAIAIGDLTGDTRAEVAISADGAVAWFDARQTLSNLDQWDETLIIDDSPPGATSGGDIPSLSDAIDLITDPQQQDQEVSTSTIVNTLLITDITGDGMNDIVGTLDRVDGSGLTNDALVLFVNRLSQ